MENAELRQRYEEAVKCLAERAKELGDYAKTCESSQKTEAEFYKLHPHLKYSSLLSQYEKEVKLGFERHGLFKNPPCPTTSCNGRIMNIRNANGEYNNFSCISCRKTYGIRHNSILEDYKNAKLDNLMRSLMEMCKGISDDEAIGKKTSVPKPTVVRLRADVYEKATSPDLTNEYDRFNACVDFLKIAD